MRRCLILLLLVSLLPAAFAQRGDASPMLRPQAPVQFESPAWQALMDLPLQPGDSLELAAPDALHDWQRPAEAQALRRSLLLAHLRMAAGLQPLPAREARLGSLWPPLAVALAEIEAAQQAALQHSLALSPRGDRPEHPGLPPAVPLPEQPGFWRINEAGQLRVLMQLSNRGPLRLSLASFGARVEWPQTGQSLPLRCGLLQRPAVLGPGQSGPLDCVSDGPAGQARGPARWVWQPAPLADDTALEQLAQALQDPRARSVPRLLRDQQSCVQQQNCNAAQQQALAERQAAQAQTALARQEAREAQRQEQALREARLKRRNALLLLAALVGGQILFVALARASGGLLLPRLLLMGGSLVLAGLLVREAGSMSRDSFAPLVIMMLAPAALMGGALLCLIYGAVYRRFFRPA